MASIAVHHRIGAALGTGCLAFAGPTDCIRYEAQFQRSFRQPRFVRYRDNHFFDRHRPDLNRDLAEFFLA